MENTSTSIAETELISLTDEEEIATGFANKLIYFQNTEG